MNVTSGGPHILLFERDQQLTTLLSGELTLAGYEVHTARTAVEVFDAIARFPVRLVMVNLAQAQAGRREFWVALDAQRRGRGVQVFTFRCTNLGGYGPDDPDERVETVLTDLEVDGMMGIVKLVEAVRARVPGSATTTSAPARPPANVREVPQGQGAGRPPEMFSLPQASPVYPAASMSTMPSTPTMHTAQPIQGTLRPQPQEMPAPQPPAPRPADAPRSGRSTFTDKIRAVIYPSSRGFSSVPETNGSSYHPGAQAQNAVQYQNPEVQPYPQASQRFAEADYPTHTYREEMTHQPPTNSMVSGQVYPAYNNSAQPPAASPVRGESGLDQLSRMLRESQPSLPSSAMNGNMQNSAPQPGLSIDPQEIQEFRSQILQAARMDEAYERSSMPQPRPAEASGMGARLRASPIQDIPFEREVAHRMNATNGGSFSPSPENIAARPAMTVLQPTQTIQPVQSMSPAYQQPAPGQIPVTENHSFAEDNEQEHPATSVREASPAAPLPSSSSQIRPMSPAQETAPRVAAQGRAVSGSLSKDEEAALSEQVRATMLHARRPEVKASDDMLLDIVKSLPPMSSPPQPPEPPQVLNGRATRSLGSVLLEGHLVPEERLQVAQHVQRMLRGVDLNYQLGEILLMFKLLTPDQLLAASLVSYGMISTMQISGLGRIRQELHAMGLEYDLESLLILFRILTPEQLREVRASWSS
jgi:hypothetical protein